MHCKQQFSNSHTSAQTKQIRADKTGGIPLKIAPSVAQLCVRLLRGDLDFSYCSVNSLLSWFRCGSILTLKMSKENPGGDPDLLLPALLAAKWVKVEIIKHSAPPERLCLLFVCWSCCLGFTEVLVTVWIKGKDTWCSVFNFYGSQGSAEKLQTERPQKESLKVKLSWSGSQASERGDCCFFWLIVDADLLSPSWAKVAAEC